MFFLRPWIFCLFPLLAPTLQRLLDVVVLADIFATARSNLQMTGWLRILAVHRDGRACKVL